MDDSTLKEEIRGKTVLIVLGILILLGVVAEQYPNLKADQNFLQLQAQLESTENRIMVERRRYNEVAQNFNTMTAPAVPLWSRRTLF